MSIIDVISKTVDTSKPYVKTVDTSKPYVKTVIGGTNSSLNIHNTMADVMKAKVWSVVVDPYSGKYFGSASKDVFTKHYEGTIKGLQGNIDYLTKNGRPQSVLPTNGFGSIGAGFKLNPTQLADQLSMLNERLASSKAELDKFNSGYEQRPQMIESFHAHPDGWNKYFESSYKNPREAESNSYLGKDTSQSSPLAISAPRKLSPTTVGTGIASTSPINPFGQLDSGLGV